MRQAAFSAVLASALSVAACVSEDVESYSPSVLLTQTQPLSVDDQAADICAVLRFTNLSKLSHWTYRGVSRPATDSAYTDLNLEPVKYSYRVKDTDGQGVDKSGETEALAYGGVTEIKIKNEPGVASSGQFSLSAKFLAEGVSERDDDIFYALGGTFLLTEKDDVAQCGSVYDFSIYNGRHLVDTYGYKAGDLPGVEKGKVEPFKSSY